MSAGLSALRDAAPSRLRIADYEARLRAERARAIADGTNARPDHRILTALRALDTWGWRVLEDRRCPGARSAPHGRHAVERGDDRPGLIAVGPGGILVVDVRSWADPDVVDGRLYRGGCDAEDELLAVRARADAIREVVAEVGLAPVLVVPVLALVGQRGTNLTLRGVKLLDEHSLVPWAVARGPQLGADEVTDLTARLDTAAPATASGRATVTADTATPQLLEGRHAEEVEDFLFDAEAMTHAVFQHAVGKPIEQWMTWLHPDQMRLVRKAPAGPARIRGAAGTGKTVVALHRAAHLAENVDGPILFTTFVTTLPPMLAQLYRQLSPTTADRVEFTGLHKWACALLRARGQRPHLDARLADTAFALAWAEHGEGTALAEAGVSAGYCREEIDYVIKGRGLADFTDYASLRRVGRRLRLSPAQRELVWAVRTDYDRRLREAGIVDFNDLIVLARAELSRRPLDHPYGAVIADEVQDLTCQAVRLLVDLARDGELLLLGDGRQQVYPGGFTLGEAGVRVTGRSTVLSVNYRNPAEIARTALALVSDGDTGDIDRDPDGDPDGGPGPDVACGDAPTSVRAGGQVRHESAPTPAALHDAVVRRVWALLEAGRPAAGVAVLCTTSGEAELYVDLLRAAGLPVLPLDRYAGQRVQAVKVGTVKRAKGLEFADVIHPEHGPHPAPSAPGTDGADADPAGAEERCLRARMRYVAMTRARDTLWLGSIA